MSEYRHTLAELEAHGIAVAGLTAAQQEVLRNLTDEELAVLADIRARLAELGPEVQAHSEIAGAALF
jgi:hypothetical protein